MSIYKTLVRPVMFSLPPETAHNIAIKFLHHTKYKSSPQDRRLVTSVGGLEIPNPIGLAGGFDKNGDGIAGLCKAGFGMIEIGTVTPKPQLGNPKPRIFRLKQEGCIINALGFNNKGIDYALENIARFKSAHATATKIGINISRNKDGTDEDYKICLQKVRDIPDYVTVNISSPNTAGLRDTQFEIEKLLKIIENAKIAQPVFIKLAPDIETRDIKPLARQINASAVNGVILTNTTISRDFEFSNQSQSIINTHSLKQKGGLSGVLLREKSLMVMQEFATYLKKDIISAGGISDPRDAKKRLESGAKAIQMYTALVYQGLGLVKDIKKRLLASQ